MDNRDEIILRPIGYVKNSSTVIPRHWSVSDIEGELVIDPEYKDGLKDISAGNLICVIFNFHKSPAFTKEKLIQNPGHRDGILGVFSLCSPYRPNPIGFSVLKVLDRSENILKVKGLDMMDNTPILDIKPYVAYKEPEQ